jgi:hypothetical protein
VVCICGRERAHAEADGQADREPGGRSGLGWRSWLDASFDRAGQARSFASAPNGSVSEICREGGFVTVTLEVDDFATRSVIQTDAVSKQDRRDVDVNLIDQIEA